MCFSLCMCVVCMLSHEPQLLKFLASGTKFKLLFEKFPFQQLLLSFFFIFALSILSFLFLSWTLQFSYQNTKTISKVFCLEGETRQQDIRGNTAFLWYNIHTTISIMKWKIQTFLSLRFLPHIQDESLLKDCETFCLFWFNFGEMGSKKWWQEVFSITGHRYNGRFIPKLHWIKHWNAKTPLVTKQNVYRF